MLIQFSVENYRSIKEEQTLSMIKNSANELPYNYFDPAAPNVPNLLHSAVIYGANASGKTSLIRSLLCMSQIVENSFSKKINEDIQVEPFLLDNSTIDEPTTFVANFIVELGTEENINPARVEYGFSLTKKQIIEEWLSVYPNGREQKWFHRFYDNDLGVYIWEKESSHFKGSKEIWKKNTRHDQLFLSTAVQLNSEQLTPIFEWFLFQVRIFDHDRIDNTFTKRVCLDPKIKKLIVSLLKQADIDVEDIEIKDSSSNFDSKNVDINKNKKNNYINSESLEAYFIHHDKNGNLVKINVDDESDGTQKIFEYAAPIFDVLFNGYTFVVDELNKSLHSDLVRFLVKIFNSETNVNNAQLIFTTHETSVLRRDLLRRDQIWFCEKNKENSTYLYPLTNFKPHKDREDIEESYLAGRYGGKPIIREFTFPLSEELNERKNDD